MPPEAVIMKLRETTFRSRSLSELKPASSPTPFDSDRFKFPRRKTVSSHKPFALHSSLEKGTKNLARITQELHVINEDLTNIIAIERQISSDSTSSSERLSRTGSVCSSISWRSQSEDEEILDLCAQAQEDLRLAHMAHFEYKTILNELGTALVIESKDMSSRANQLRRDGEQFQKLSHKALTRIRQQSEGGDEA